MRFDSAALQELADSIIANGIVQPLLVRRRHARFELVAGERRLRAAKLAGLKVIPVIVRDVPDEKLLEIALVENIQRENLNPIEEAQAYKRLLESVGLTQESLAARVGRDRSYITNYLRLLRLPPVVQELVQDKSLSTGHARALLGVADLERQKELAQTIVRKALSVRETEQLIRRDAGKPRRTKSRPTHERDPNVRAFEARLRRELGTQVRVVPKPGSNEGTLHIEYYSLNDLARITDRLTPVAVHNTAGSM
jgi:ParB family chromosome partitioning protein